PSLLSPSISRAARIPRGQAFSLCKWGEPCWALGLGEIWYAIARSRCARAHCGTHFMRGIALRLSQEGRGCPRASCVGRPGCTGTRQRQGGRGSRGCTCCPQKEGRRRQGRLVERRPISARAGVGAARGVTELGTFRRGSPLRAPVPAWPPKLAVSDVA